MNVALDVLSVRQAAGPTDWKEASALLRQYVDWLRSSARIDPFTEQPSFARELDDLAGHYASQHRTLLVAFLGENAVGTVALVRHPDETAEIKRMYVRPSARGLGVADALLGHAIDLAAAHGCGHVWLESVSGAMDPAIAVYRRNGFRFVEDADPTMGIEGLVVMRRELATPRLRSGASGLTIGPPRPIMPNGVRRTDT